MLIHTSRWCYGQMVHAKCITSQQCVRHRVVPYLLWLAVAYDALNSAFLPSCVWRLNSISDPDRDHALHFYCLCLMCDISSTKPLNIMFALLDLSKPSVSAIYPLITYYIQLSFALNTWNMCIYLIAIAKFNSLPLLPLFLCICSFHIRIKNNKSNKENLILHLHVIHFYAYLIQISS